MLQWVVYSYITEGDPSDAGDWDQVDNVNVTQRKDTKTLQVPKYSLFFLIEKVALPVFVCIQSPFAHIIIIRLLEFMSWNILFDNNNNDE